METASSDIQSMATQRPELELLYTHWQINLRGVPVVMETTPTAF